jgi:hypothetical protein
MLEELAAKVTGHKDAFVYYIEGDGPEYRLLVPGQPPSTYLGETVEDAQAVLEMRIRREEK